MERLDLLIERIRRYTATQSYTDAAALASQIGVQTQTMVDLFNEAQHAAHGIIFASAPDIFIKTETQDITADTESYNMPSDAFLGANIISVEYKYGDGTNDYIKLDKKDSHMRGPGSGTPNSYIQHHDTILLSPIPATAVTDGLRITYEYRLPELDVRRGKVSAVDDGSNPTSITITDNTSADYMLGANAPAEYITVVDKDGNIQMDEIAVSAYNSSTGVITCSVSAAASEAVAVDDYVVIGKRATTHSVLPSFCEAFLVKYVEHSVLELLGHPGANNAAAKLGQLQFQLADVFSNYNTDIMLILEHDTDRIIDF
jgi:hypothetical protein